MSVRSRFLRRASALAAALLLVSCTSVTPPAAPTPAPEAPTDRSGPPLAPRADSRERQPLSPLALQRLRARGLKPIEEKPLAVETRCEFKDIAGGNGRMDLHVAQAEVKRFSAEITIPNRGVCAFDLKDFRQSERIPNVQLSAASGRCVVRMWEQGGEVTVAFNGCAERCSGDAFTYLWPVLVDSKSGRCS